MKWRRKLLLAACAALAIAARGELADYIQRLEIADRLQGVFFHSATLPAGPVLVRRPPAETRQALGLMISASAGDAQLYALRAQEAELALDFAAAEADWKKHAELAQDKAAGADGAGRLLPSPPAAGRRDRSAALGRGLRARHRGGRRARSAARRHHVAVSRVDGALSGRGGSLPPLPGIPDRAARLVRGRETAGRIRPGLSRRPDLSRCARAPRWSAGADRRTARSRFTTRRFARCGRRSWRRSTSRCCARAAGCASISSGCAPRRRRTRWTSSRPRGCSTSISSSPTWPRPSARWAISASARKRARPPGPRERVAGPGPPVRSGPQLRRSGAVLPRALQPAGGRAGCYRRRAGVAGEPAVERAGTTGPFRRRRLVVLQGHRDRR